MEKLVKLESTHCKYNSQANSICLLESFLYTGHENGELQVMNLLKKNPKEKKINAHQNSITSSTISSSLQYLITTSLDKSFKVWNMAQPMRPKVFNQKNFSSCLRDADFCPKSQFCVIGCDDKSAKIFSVKNLKFKASLKGHTNWISCCNFSQYDQQKIITGGYDKKVMLWDVNQSKMINSQKLNEKISHAKFFSNDQYFMTAENNGIVKVFDTRLNQLVQKYDAHQGNVKDIIFEDSQFYFLSIGDDNTMKFWDLRNGANYGLFQHNDSKINCFTFYQQQQKIITAGMDIKIWLNPIQKQPKQVDQQPQKECGTKICSNSQFSANYIQNKPQILDEQVQAIIKPQVQQEPLKVLKNVIKKEEKKVYQEDPEITNTFNVIIDQLSKINETVALMDTRIRKNEDDILHLTQMVQKDIENNQIFNQANIPHIASITQVAETQILFLSPIIAEIRKQSKNLFIIPFFISIEKISSKSFDISTSANHQDNHHQKTLKIKQSRHPIIKFYFLQCKVFKIINLKEVVFSIRINNLILFLITLGLVRIKVYLITKVKVTLKD